MLQFGRGCSLRETDRLKGLSQHYHSSECKLNGILLHVIQKRERVRERVIDTILTDVGETIDTIDYMVKLSQGSTCVVDTTYRV